MRDNATVIREFVERHVRGVTLRDDEDFFASGHVTSLFGMQLVQFVERAFNVVVENDDLELANFRSVQALSAFVARKTGL